MPMDDDEYKNLLESAKTQLPDEIASHERFEVPVPEVMVEGKTTIIRNFAEIAESINREPEHLLAFLLKELGTPGTIEGRRVVFKSKLPESLISERINEYIQTYVLCSECGRPDTRLVRDGRILMLECDACGAKRPVHVKKGSSGKAREPNLIPGNIYTVRIQDVGNRGDGIARIGKYIIYIPGTTKGSEVRVKIMTLRGTRAYGTVVRE